MKQSFLRILAALLPLALAACASPGLRLYDGPQRPAGEVAVVTLPEQLEVASINGTEVPGAKGMWTRGDKRLELAPGRYELLVYYREVWQANGDSDVLRSNPALFTVDAAAGHEYRIDYPHPPRYDDARALSKDFHGWVEDRSAGTRIASTDSGLRFKGGLAAQVTGDNTLVAAEGAKGEAAPAVRPLAVPAPVVPAAPSAASVSIAPPAAPAPVTPIPVAPPAPARDWVALMKGWWQQASPEERREFLRWVGERP